MTKIKLCGLSRISDIEAANQLNIDYVGFVFATGSKRYVLPKKAEELKKILASDIKAVGVFVKEPIKNVAELLNKGIIDIAQLHGGEDEDYIWKLRNLTDKPIIKAFRVENAKDIADAECSTADFVLLDSGCGGTGSVFDWGLIKNMKRPFFLAGGLSVDNIGSSLKELHPYAVDVSSGIETDGIKDKYKMMDFVTAIRKEDRT